MITRSIQLCLALLLAIANGAGSAAAAATAVYTDAQPAVVLQLIRERLALMPEVARYKHVHGLPVEDRPREEQVLARAAAEAGRFGIEPDSVVALFRAQIEAAKAVQYATAAPAAGYQPQDLNTQLRPALGAIGAQLNSALALALPDLAALAPAATQQLTADGVPAVHAAAIGAALGQVRAALPRLDYGVIDMVRARGVLRVGTTGDYAPFSERLDSGTYVGIDIDLAQDLAASLEVTLLLVPTSWPNMLQDLQAGRFDLAMGGISRRLFRAHTGLLSAAYHSGGKAPVSRCADAARFAELTAINRPDVQVLVNPGGTNERFVRTHLANAQITVVDDNLDIFARLAAGEGDVMITDDIEIRLQTRRFPQLCATRSTPFNVQTKGYLLPRDPIWLAYVNLWLAERRADDTLRAAFDRHLNPSVVSPDHDPR